MALADGAGLPLAITVASANPSEISLVEDTLASRFLRRLPTRIIGDRGYDSDALDAQLATRGIEFIAPHRSTRRNITQDGRQLRRYCRRWKIERLFAWLQNFRRLVTRYERHVENFLAFVQLACIIILSRRFVRCALALLRHFLRAFR
jgi:transposase